MMKPSDGDDPKMDTEADPTMTDPESLEASQKEQPKSPSQTKRNLRTLGLLILAYVAIAGLVLGIMGVLKANDSDDDDESGVPTATSDDLLTSNPSASASGTSPVLMMELEGSTTLHEIVNRGKLVCGIALVKGFGEVSESGVYAGFDVDLCRAVASAIFLTNPDNAGKNVDDFVTFESIRENTKSGSHWLEPLAEGQYDVLAAITTHTAERDIYHEESGAGFTFSVPYLYDGLRFGGPADKVTCADNLDVTNGNCAGLKICAHRGTTILDVLLETFPAENIVELSGGAKVLTDGLDSGDCDVIAGDVVVASHLDTTKYHMGSSQLSREPLAMVTRDDDARFSDFVNWVLEALFTADEQGITSETAQTSFEDIPHFGATFEGMLAAAVTAVGNYEEIYSRNLASIVPRSGLNTINAGTSGLIFSTPFGNLDVMGPGPREGGTIDQIKKRGHLNCGITRRAGFGVFNTESLQWEGFDVDYCKALSAALFDGVAHNVVYHVLPATERFIAQAMGKVDVLSRITTYTLERDVLEPTSMQGFSFSQPVFYDGLSFGGIPSFAIECADALDTTSGICASLKICVNDGTTTVMRTRELFPEENIVVKPTGEEALAGLVTGECNVVAGGSHDLARASVESVGYTEGDYAIGANRFSKEPLALVTNQDDAEWSDFVYWVVTSTFYAEEQGITKEFAGKMPTTNLFGPLYTRMFINAVQAVGNHGEIYARNVEELVPRGGLNVLNSGGAQIYPLPGIPLSL